MGNDVLFILTLESPTIPQVAWIKVGTDSEIGLGFGRKEEPELPFYEPSFYVIEEGEAHPDLVRYAKRIVEELSFVTVW